MSPAVVRGSGGPTPTALLLLQSDDGPGLPAPRRVGERGFGQHSEPRPRGNHRRPFAAILGTARWTPGKSYLFLLMGTRDHGTESIERRWSPLPEQPDTSVRWEAIHLAH